MTKPTIPSSNLPALMPEQGEAVAQIQAEQHLQALILAGLRSGPAAETTIAELTAELRQRLKSKE